VKKPLDDEPREYFERNILLILVILAIAAVLAYCSYLLFADFNPMGAFVGIPVLVLLFQALWMTLNPYAIVYEDRFDLKQSFFWNNQFYYLDLKAVSEVKGMFIYLTYNDGDITRIPLFGMRASHKANFRNKINQLVCKSLVERED